MTGGPFSSSTINCRQCGTTVSVDEQAVELKCPDCGWRELLPRRFVRRPAVAPDPVEVAEEALVTVGSATETLAEEAAAVETVVLDAATAEVSAGEDETLEGHLEGVEGVEDEDDEPSGTSATACRWQGLPHDELVDRCGRLLGCFGYTHPTGDRSRHHDYDLELVREGQLVLVDCIPAEDDDCVGRGACQKLLGAMVAGRASRGIILTPGSFEDGCRELLEHLPGDVRIDLVDGDRLEATITEMETGPLAAWWR